jgi:acyl-CoA synthetase (NDP forming)
MYLESFGNPRKFGRVARRVARAKPVLAVKAGRTSAGARAAASHTGALIAASDAAVEALFAGAGVIRCHGLDDLLDAAAVLSEQPLPSGSSVGLVGNARGPLVVCADACADAGLEVAALAAGTQEALRARLTPSSTVAGPVQLVADDRPERFRAAVEQVAGDPGVDAVVAIFVEHIATGADEAAAALSAAELGDTPLLAVFMTPGPLPGVLRRGAKIPAFRTPEAAAQALGRAAAYAGWRRTAPAVPRPPQDADPDAAAAVLARSLARGGGWLKPEELDVLLGAYGIPLVEQRRVGSPAAAAKAAAELGGAVALKGLARGVVHKARAGAVRLGLSGPTAVRRAAHEVADHLTRAGTPPSGFLVQPMVGPGVEMLVGVLADERFGPVVACGAGGGTAEVLGDIGVRLAPLARDDALAMIRGLRSHALLDRERADVDALADIAVRVGALADGHPAITELDLNPVVVSREGAAVVDARVRVAPPPVQPLFPAL